jgi:integrase
LYPSSSGREKPKVGKARKIRGFEGIMTRNVPNDDVSIVSEHDDSDPVRMQPFERDDVELIRRTLRARKDYRQLALFNLGIDSMLRGGDLVRVRVSTVRDATGKLRDTITVRQGKTGKLVTNFLSPWTIESIRQLIAAEDKWQMDYLFTRTTDAHGKHLTEVSLRRFVKEWAKLAHKDPAEFSSHSIRRTKPSIVYAETQDIEICRQLLGHQTTAATSAYLDVGRAKVEAVARRFEI